MQGTVPPGGAGGVSPPPGPETVKVGVLPIVDVAPLFLGKEKGFFTKRGIDLKTTIAPAGPAIVPGPLSSPHAACH